MREKTHSTLDMSNVPSSAGGVALKAGTWYVVSTVMVRAVGVITTPIFTRLLTTEQYGVTSTFNSWYSLLITFCTLNLTYGIGRAKQDYPDKLDDYIGSMQLLSAFVTAILATITIIFIKPISNFIELSVVQTLLLVAYLFFSPSISFYQNGFRYRYRYKENIAIAWYTTTISVVLSLVFIFFLGENRDTSRILGITLTTVVLSICFWINSFRKKRLKVNLEYWKYGITLCGPLILHTVSIHILSTSDRIFISKIFGSGDTGIYSLAYSYGVLLSVITNAIAEGWLPWFHDNYFIGNYKAVKENSKWIVILGCYMSLACIALAPEAIALLGGSNYAVGVYCVPPVVMGVLCQYVYTHYVNIELHLKKTKYVSYGTMSAAALNLILNAIFIPKYGFVAAAYTTLFSYIALMFAHFLITRFVLHVKLYNDAFMFGSIAVVGIIDILLVNLYELKIQRYFVIGIGFLTFLVVFRKFIFGYLKKIVKRKLD